MLNISSSICKNYIFFVRNQNEEDYKKHLLQSSSLQDFFKDFSNFKKLFRKTQFTGEFNHLIERIKDTLSKFYDIFNNSFSLKEPILPVSNKNSSQNISIIQKPVFSKDYISSIQDFNDEQNNHIPKDILITFTDLNKTPNQSNKKEQKTPYNAFKRSSSNLQSPVTSNIFNDELQMGNKKKPLTSIKYNSNTKKPSNPLNILIPQLKLNSKETSKSTNTNSNQQNFSTCNNNNFPNNIFSSKNHDSIKSNKHLLSKQIRSNNHHSYYLNQAQVRMPKKGSLSHYMQDLEMKKRISSPIHSHYRTNKSQKLLNTRLQNRNMSNSSYKSIIHNRSNSINKPVNFSIIERSSNRNSVTKNENANEHKMFSKIKQMMMFGQKSQSKIEKFSMNQFKK